MNVDLMQAYAPYAAAGAVLLIAILVLGVRRRRGAAEAQAALQAEYAADVTSYREQVEQLLGRRQDLLAAIATIESGHLGETLHAGDIDTTDPVARLELDVLLAGDDQDQRASSLRTLRRGVSDLEMLLPEAPLPPAPAAQLSRSARRRAEQWTQARVAELDGLRALARPSVVPAAHVPAQAAGPREVAPSREDAAVAS